MGNAAQTIAPTSGEAEFNPQIDDIIEEAYERTGVLGTRTGYQLRSARRSLNLIFKNGVIEVFIYGKLNLQKFL